MKRLLRTTTYGLVATAALCLASGPSFANEAGDYHVTLAGATIGSPAGARSWTICKQKYTKEIEKKCQ
jgi:hypothetical protein